MKRLRITVAVVVSLLLIVCMLGACQNKEETIPTQEEICAEFDALVSDQLSSAQIQKIMIAADAVHNYRAKYMAEMEIDGAGEQNGKVSCNAQINCYDAKTMGTSVYAESQYDPKDGGDGYGNISDYALRLFMEYADLAVIDLGDLDLLRYSEEKQGYVWEVVEEETIVSIIFKFKDGHLIGCSQQAIQKDPYDGTKYQYEVITVYYDFDQVQLSDVQPQ